jgi:hypothetical protein
MDIPDAIPSRGDDAVVVSDCLREILRQTAERRLREACDLAFPPDGRDEVIDAVHLIDAFTGERVTAEVVLSLIPLAIAWQQSDTSPSHTAEALAPKERALRTVRELVELCVRLGGEPPAAGAADVTGVRP